jgi:Zn ribbon nucleic-acid-binding protein
MSKTKKQSTDNFTCPKCRKKDALVIQVDTDGDAHHRCMACDYRMVWKKGGRS